MDTIYLIRHAEKPTDATDDGDAAPAGAAPVYAFDASGAQDKESLTAKGWTRSGSWAVYFLSGAVLKPDRIFASAADKMKEGHGVKAGSHSKRPIETVQALADRIVADNPSFVFDTTHFLKGDEDALVAALVQQTGVTLVAWQHERNSSIAGKIVGDPSKVPATWPGDRFDVVFKFTRADGGSAWDFEQICPQLLAGDPATPIPLAAT